MMMTDTQLQKDVMAELKWDSSIDATKIGVEVDNDVVNLSGHAENYAQKWSAERAVQKVCGVKALVVNIKVVLQESNNRSDADIARTAEIVLEWTTNWPKDHVKVMVECGWVLLSGELNYKYQRQLAAASVRRLMGVTGVSNQIAVKPSLSSLSIKSDIHAALRRRALIDAEEIVVTVNGGNVNLFGVAQSWSERDMVSDCVWSKPSLNYVTDNISVAY
jgi:osmotically-inducible protein OsmY